jgi:23S rRNA (adenine2030-N6)-methyltransferase
MLLRPHDQLRAFELHPTEQKILRATLAATPSAIAYDGDGFVGLKSQLPPSSRRAAVLIDPSYEGNADYGRVVATLREALARFAPGVYMVWYPQVSKLEAAGLPKRLEALAPKGWLHARLSVQQPDAQGFGLAGSGMFVINPPHALAAQLQTVLPWLVDVLGQYDGAHFALDPARRLKRGRAPPAFAAAALAHSANEKCRELSRHCHAVYTLLLTCQAESPPK